MILSTHASRLERWLGAPTVDHLSRQMIGWYGPPIAIAGVPGRVFAHPGGDFRGSIQAGAMGSAVDWAVERLKAAQRRVRRAARLQRHRCNAGFSSLSDLISEATAGKRREFQFSKAGSTGVVNVTNSLWRLGAQPPAGATPGNAAAGTAFDDTSTGGFPFTNPTAGDTQHFVAGYPLASVAPNTLLLFDLLFGVNKTMNSTATEAVTGVPTRYQSTTSSNQDYVGGNFLFIQVGGTALAATAHNWTVCTYKDQADAASTLPSLTGNASAIVDRLDHPAGQWFAPLETGDVGIKALTQMQCSAAVATGVIWFMIGHPLAWMPCPIANLVCTADGINTAFSFVRIFDDACMAFLEVCKSATTATNYAGTFTTVAG